MKVEVIMPIDLRDRRSVPIRITGYLDKFQCNGETFYITQTIRGMSLRDALGGTEREAEINLRAVAMVMAAMLLEHGKDIDTAAH